MSLRPRPAQARLMRLMSQHQPGHLLRVWFATVELVEREKVEIEDRLWPRGIATLAHRSTAMSCVRYGWLARLPIKREAYWRMGGEASFYELTVLGAEAIAGLPETAFVSLKKPPKAQSDSVETIRIMRALASRHDYGKGWIFIPEAPMDFFGRVHHVDGFAFNCYRSNGYRRVGYEVKVTRSDFAAEMKKPQKTARSAAFCTAFYFACPLGLLKASEIPDPYGLVVVNAEGKTAVTKKSSVASAPPEWGLLARLLRRNDEL